MLFTVLFYVFVISVTIQLLYYLFLFGKFSFSNQQKITPKAIPVSIIICAKNEAENLNENLTSILTQNYPNFEVIVVNDASTDNTISILNTFKNDYLNLKIVDIKPTPEYRGNKKNAATKGIEMTTNEHLLFTDADCKPNSKNWIIEMTSQFTEDKTIILGYGSYQKIKNSLLNKLIRFETLLTAVQYFSYAKIGIPYMGVGRNLAYTKNVFNKANGFSNHAHIQSGDDDLLINQIANKKNTAICFSKTSFTISKPKKTFTKWFKQKRRHLTTANHYNPIHQFLLGLFYLSQFLFWILAIILLVLSFKWQLVTILLIIRLTTQYIILGNSAKKLCEKDLIIFFPILDFILVISQFGVYLSNLISKPTSW
ncbi:MAG: glycosyltransferase [Flavobacteriaceae bacterium]|nr:glycosyltransferase [Flavobacteriaceae bacterium]